MISFDEACKLIAECARPLGTGKVPLAEAHGRTLSAPVVSAVASPRANVSAMDGYCVKEADLASLPARLRVVCESFPGTADPGSIGVGECSRIFTGAPIPAGADRVVIQEDVERDGETAVFTAPLSPSKYIRKCGSDFPAGANLLDTGTRFGPRQLVAAAAADYGMIKCYRQPVVRILATGDELAEPGTARSSMGAVPESVSIALAALVHEWGGVVAGIEHVQDSISSARKIAETAARSSDVLVITGGASVGERDFAKPMIEPLGGGMVFSKVAIKPGKPAWLAKTSGPLAMGLPGNPTSAMVTARLLLAPLLAGLAGRLPDEAWQWSERTLGGPLPANGERETFLRARFGDDETIWAVTNQESHAQHALALADMLIRRAPDAPPVEAGERVSVLNF